MKRCHYCTGRAIAENDIQNRFAVALNYELQYGKNFAGLKNLTLGGWEINAIAAWQSGKPFTIINSVIGVDSPVESDGKQHWYINRSTPLNSGGNDRPDQLGDAKVSNPSITHFFDTTKFAPQPLGTVGTGGRNPLFGPHFRHVDLSLFKNFPVTERVTLQFRAETLNISNTPNSYMQSDQPGDSLGNAAFGQISPTDPNYPLDSTSLLLRCSSKVVEKHAKRPMMPYESYSAPEMGNRV